MEFLSKYTLACLLATFLLFSCGNEAGNKGVAKENAPAPSEQKTSNPYGVHPETAKMIAAVQAAESRVDPMKINYYLTTQRASLFMQQAEQAKDLERINILIKYGGEALKAGQTESAIRTLEYVYDEVKKRDINEKEKNLRIIKQMLAVAYLRKGEQENCIRNHTSASCIIPIAPEGQHELREGSEKAIELYKELLAEEPDDAQSRYLLNLAYMTLGEWPDEVPKEYLIPPDRFETRVNFPRFIDIASNLGVDIQGLSGGICLDDFNNDGYIDIMASSWGFGDQVRYLVNMGDGTFQDRTEEAMLTGVGGGLNMQHADYNNDGHIDFIILRGAWMGHQGRIPNSLIRNNGDGTFTDVTRSAGVYSEMPTQTAVWADFNLDGWVDLFIGNESPNGKDFPCELYLNQKNGKFRNVASDIGMDIRAFVKGVTAGDLSNDGYPELYLSVMGKPNVLGLNRALDGLPGFTNISEFSGVEEPEVSFPTWFFDYNNDGFNDIFVSAYSPGQTGAANMWSASLGERTAHEFRPRVYKNNGDGTFEEMSEQLGLREPAFTMGSNYGDINNDGWPDFYLATGEPNLNSIVPNKMYLNIDGKRFEDITYGGGFGNIQKGHGVGFADFDQDGDQDVYAVMGGAYEGDIYQNILYENPGHGNNWVTIRLVGTTSNRSAIGAMIALTVSEQGRNTRKIYHLVGTGSSFGGNSLQAEIGIGKADSIEFLSVLWPNKARDQDNFGGVPINKIYEIVEGSGSMTVKDPRTFEFRKEKMEMGHDHDM